MVAAARIAARSFLQADDFTDVFITKTPLQIAFISKETIFFKKVLNHLNPTRAQKKDVLQKLSAARPDEC